MRTGHLEAVHLRQAQVEQHQIGPPCSGDFERRRAIERQSRFVAQRLEQQAQKFRAIGIVINHQHPPRLVAERRGRGHRGSRGQRGLIDERQANLELTALAGAGAAGRDHTAVHFHQTARDGQPQTQAAERAVERGVDLGKEVEHLVEHGGRNAHAGVAHRDHGPIAIAPRRDGDLAVFGGVFRRVVEQVGDHLRQPHGVAAHRERQGHDVDVEQLLASVDQGPADLDRLGDHVGKIERLEAKLDRAMGNPGHIEQIIDQAGHEMGLTFDDVDREEAFAVGAARHAQEFDPTENRGQRVA